MSDHDWLLSNHKGDTVLAVMLTSADPPGTCNCGGEIGVGEYYIKHKVGGVWHVDCHFGTDSNPMPIASGLKKIGRKPRGFFS